MILKHRFSRISVLLLSLITFLNCCAQQAETFDQMVDKLLSHTVKEVSVNGMKAMDEATLLDAREWEEFEVSHIPGAKWVGYKSFEEGPINKLGIKKDEMIIVYCSVGYRSEKIAEKLEKMGYLNVHNLYGGIFDWVNQGGKVVNPAGETTTKIHAYNKKWGKWLYKGEKTYSN